MLSWECHLLFGHAVLEVLGRKHGTVTLSKSLTSGRRTLQPAVFLEAVDLADEMAGS